MSDISELEGITPGEVYKLCRANITTVEEFVAQFDPEFIYGVTYLFLQTGIKPSRVLELLPPSRLTVDFLPDSWIEELAQRVLHRAEPDERWLKRCRYGLRRFRLRLKGNWEGWKSNLPIFVLAGVLLAVLALALHAAGVLSLFPSSLGLRERALVAAADMEAGRALKPADFYSAVLPFQNDYFKPDAKLDGLILARKLSGQKPLRFGDVLRPQVVALKDIQANETIQQDQVSLIWTPYQSGAALTLKEVCGYKATQPLRKDGVILTEFVRPAE